jgi:trans-aconitate methyltransferase
VHARWLVEWLPDKRLALRRMASALRPGGFLLIEEPDFVTIYESGDSLAVRHVFVAAMRPSSRRVRSTANTAAGRWETLLPWT